MSALIPEARLLIVDDSIPNVSLLRSILSRLGFSNFDTTNDSRETFKRVDEFHPDLIILDLNMPHLDGFEVMERLSKERARAPFLPVLVFTADATGETRQKAQLAGATDLLNKPFNTAELFMRVRNLLQIRFLNLELQALKQKLALHSVAVGSI